VSPIGEKDLLERRILFRALMKVERAYLGLAGGIPDDLGQERGRGFGTATPDILFACIRLSAA
jgi:hypothetical protein